MCGLTVIKDAGVSGDKPVLNCLASPVGWLAFIPEERMGVKIARSQCEWADAADVSTVSPSIIKANVARDVTVTLA